MTERELAQIEKTLAVRLPGFAIRRTLMYKVPLGGMLRGLNFEGSSFDRTLFYVNAFVMPMCVPSTHLHFAFGDRVRVESRNDGWTADMPNLVERLNTEIVQHAMPVFQRAETAYGFVEFARTTNMANPHTRQAISFVLARAGDFAGSVEELGILIDMIDSSVAWQLNIKQQAVRLRTLLLNDQNAAVRQLDAWESETKAAIGLDIEC